MADVSRLEAIAWPAPAKLNLFLQITGQRADGYHELQTVFQFLDFADQLRFRHRDDGVIQRVGGHPDIPESQDLVVRAARVLQQVGGGAFGADIHLDKQLPLGGGLGGGSSDAATTLVVLNRLWQLHLEQTQLLALALGLGADVPVFIGGQAAWAEGVGERLSPIDLPQPWYVVLQPAVQVSTRELFADPELTRHASPLRIRDFLAGQGRNVFEPLVRRRCPEVDAAMTWLDAHAPARLTGTGACVFAAFETETAARRVADQAQDRWSARVARGLNRSPLHDLLTQQGF